MNRLVMMVMKNIWRVPGAYAKLCHYARQPEKYPELEKYSHIQKMMRWAVAAGKIDLQVFGLDKLPRQNGYLMYANHQGMFDVVAIATAYDGPLATVFKKELRNIPLLKQVIACTKSFAMDREDVRQSLTVIQAVTQEVMDGRNYIIFPEGTRSKNGNHMGEFHGGSFRCAVKAKCPVVPVVFVNSFKVLDQKGCKPVSVELHFLEPVTPQEYEGLKAAELAALVKSRIQAVLDRALRE